MASLGRLATGLSHEIQNPLNFVNNFSEVSQELLEELKKTNLSAEQKSLVDELLEGNGKVTHHGKRAQLIVQRMQDHGNLSAGRAEATDLNVLSAQSLERVQLEMRTDLAARPVKLITRFDDTLPPLTLNVSQFARVLHNVFKNAFQAVLQKAHADAGYQPEIRVETRRNGAFAEVLCNDNGPGMDAETLERAFEPFFTTKPAGTASGLGLSLSYDIVKGHRGEMLVQSEPGRYTEVAVRLPVDGTL
jgi:signal transduction histidine kinase